MRKSLAVAVLMLAAVQAHANVSLNGLFMDHMVLQRDVTVPVFGTAEPGEKVSVSLAGQLNSTVADKDGKWSVKFNAMKASTDAVTMTVEGKNKVVVNDIVIGDVWLCSGQSNMEFGLGECNRPEDVKGADIPLLRQFLVPPNQAAAPCEDVKSAWVVCSPQSAAGFTAVGFYFARRVHKETRIPIGLIKSTWNATTIETWVSPEGLQAVPEANHAPVKIAMAPSDWHRLYYGMIHPLIRFPIKGALWYQGESNAIFNQDDKREESYLNKERALIGGWRKAWNVGDFPFYLVQLASIGQPNNDPESGHGWMRIQMAQLRALAIPNTGLAVAVDLPPDPGNLNDFHPKNKKDVGERLAAWALARDYGKKLPAYSGPLYKSMKVEGDKIRITFDSTGSGRMIARKSGYDAPVKDPQGKLQRCAIAGEDRKWVWADAVIDGKTVVVSSPSVPKPAAVRYAFSTNPEGCNLYNNEGFPASPFRTDNW